MASGALGSSVRHSMELTALDEGRCQLRHLEYATGLLAILALPAERAAHRHDKLWSDAIVARFATSAP